MASANETVLLKSTLEINNKPYSVKLTPGELYWEKVSPSRAASGPYSEPLVIGQSGLSQSGLVVHSLSVNSGVSEDSGFATDEPQTPECLPDVQECPEQTWVTLVIQDVQEKVDGPQEEKNEEESVTELKNETCVIPQEKDKPTTPQEKHTLPTPQQKKSPQENGLQVFSSMSLPYVFPNRTCKECLALRQTENQTVKLNEVIAVRLESGRVLNNEGKFQQLEMVPMPSSSFSIHVVRRVGRHRWRDRKVTFSSTDSSIAQQWVEKIQEIISKPEWNRPKNLLVFINPVGGKRKGAKIYAEKVAPLFDLAAINVENIVTQRANHARDHLLECDLSKYDGVVCVGGDGMVSELMHGLLTRSMRESGLDHLPPGTRPVSPPIRIGIIPGGSTDTTAYTTVGINDPATSAIHIILGDSIGIDVATVHHGNQFLRYNVSLLGYGYFGDCMMDSENYRWMGPRRYDFAGFKKLVAHRSYEGEISYVQSPDSENHPKDQTVCRAGCQVCQAQPPSPENEVEGEQWQKIKGRFMGINCFVMSCRCGMSPVGPASAAHLGDGHIDMILVKETSRINYGRFLMRLRDKTSDQFDFPFIQTLRVKALSFRPLVDEIDDTHESGDSTADGAQRLRSRVSHNSVWNCDGEIVEEPAVDVRCHRQVLRMFARGIEEEMPGPKTCFCCAKSVS